MTRTTTPPEHLDEQALAKWAEVLPILEGRGDLDQGTLDALAAYATAWSRWTAAEAQVSTLGLVVKSPAGFPVANPYAAAAAAASRQMRQWSKVLGLTTRSRKAAEPEADQGNGLLRLLAGTSTKGRKTKAG